MVAGPAMYKYRLSNWSWVPVAPTDAYCTKIEPAQIKLYLYDSSKAKPKMGQNSMCFIDNIIEFFNFSGGVGGM